MKCKDASKIYLKKTKVRMAVLISLISICCYTAESQLKIYYLEATMQILVLNIDF